MKRICDRCKKEVEYTNNGKKITGGCDINIGIDKMKGKYFLCMPCTAEFVNLFWEEFYKNGGKNGGTT